VAQRMGYEGLSLQGVKGNCGAHGNDVDDETDRRCDQDCVDGNAQGWVHL
jgi:hypothetical protein